MSSAQAIVAWAVSACAVIAILVRPFRTPEWVWAAGAAVVLVVSGVVPWHAAASAVLDGLDVYAFLIGILTISEVARTHGLFAWLATRIRHIAKGSQRRLFALLYAAGAVVTALLSNDTTVVVLTPAVLAVLAQTDVEPLPYLYACAFVANAASFVLPISNPANLVLFGHDLPALIPWVCAFGAAAVASVLLTYAVIRLGIAGDVRGSFRERHTGDAPSLAIVPAVMVCVSALALLIAAVGGAPVGVAAFAAALVTVLVCSTRDRAKTLEALRHVTWQVVPLVGGLFVIVAALDRAGAVATLRRSLSLAHAYGFVSSHLLAGAALTIASNLLNNLPVGMLVGVTLHQGSFDPTIAHVAVVAVDLGPNLSVTGSLATLLWLIVLRRNGIELTAWQFLRTGALVLAPALIAALLLVR